MGKRSWDVFVKANPKAICVVTGFGWKAPRVGLARDGRKFPTPYGVLIEVLGKTLKGDWTIRSERNGKATLIHIALVDRSDLALIGKIFQIGQNPNVKPPAPCAELHQFPYDPSDYARLTKACGYVPA
ncbi:hypothetical protein [Methylocystis sp. ATCC 49242]|uniref:hypothetical protein n=1 Tax=Methylocystis sp. ATCC 49242 TaxID=622637 RepID=UPI0001F880A1|nr:hypothetical protein [Methylocystis sp. ATCC 49242]